jgi:hypothetical protein
MAIEGKKPSELDDATVEALRVRLAMSPFPVPLDYVLTRAAVLAVWPGPIKVAFTSTDTPTLGNWQVDYVDDYGEWPTVQLWITGSTKPSDVVPERNELGGLLDNFTWDIGEDVTGFFLIKK